jgi:hypothetical protein
MAQRHKSEAPFSVFLSDGAEIIVSSFPHVSRYSYSVADESGVMLHKFLASFNRVFFIAIIGRLIGDSQERLHHISPKHIVRISPYVESESDTEPVGCATLEKPLSEEPPFEVSGY